MFSIYNGATEFKQWDLDQLVVNDCMKEGDEVVFCAHGKAYETTAFVQDGKVVADVPNFLLQESGEIRVDLGWGLDVHLDCRTYLTVTAQAKPKNYVCEYNIKDRTEKGVAGGSTGGGFEPDIVISALEYDSKTDSYNPICSKLTPFEELKKKIMAGSVCCAQYLSFDDEENYYQTDLTFDLCHFGYNKNYIKFMFSSTEFRYYSDGRLEYVE